MSVITDAIYNKLLADTKLTGTKNASGAWNGDGLISVLGSKSAVYDPVTGTYKVNQEMAIYPFEPAPLSDPNLRSCVVFAGHVTDVPSTNANSKTRRARDITVDLKCYYKQVNLADRTYNQVEAVAERVYEIFNRKPMVIPNPSDPTNYTKWQTVYVTANGPILIGSEQEKLFSQGLDMMVVTIRFTVQEFK